LKPAWEKLTRPYLKNKVYKQKGWGGGMTQWILSQYHTKEKEEFSFLIL
jgi:hypothetical protein